MNWDEIDKYKPTWNVEAFNAVEEVDVVLRETEPSRMVIMEYADIPNYAGLSVFLDNINKIMYVWVSEYAKHRGWVKKKIVKAKTPKEFAVAIILQFARDLKVDMRDYKVVRVNEGQETEDFEWLFMYEIAEIGLYSQFYPKPEYQLMFQEREERLAAERAAKEALKKCPKCGWLLTSGKTVCPRCKHDLGKA